jgi:hypothetical protein
VGALGERLAESAVQYCVLSACNSRRLFRSAIYDTLDPASDRLFLPPTLGIMNRTGIAVSTATAVQFLARADSHIESVSVGNTRELSLATRDALGIADDEHEDFVISDLLIQLLIKDAGLDLRVATPVETVNRESPEARIAERLFARFVAYLDQLAAAPGDRLVPLVSIFARYGSSGFAGRRVAPSLSDGMMTASRRGGSEITATFGGAAGRSCSP